MDNVKINDARDIQRVAETKYSQFIYDSENDERAASNDVRFVIYFSKAFLEKTAGCNGVTAKFSSESSTMTIPFATDVTLTLNSGFVLGDIMTIHTGVDSKAVKLICR